ncbi:hypothetical protein H2198_005124 [Neophaeococcomyces mojaviensis]|uniref:Uncharacterized protein n=1 Tax=Neophaeococcomyces mojaviensis TaxID=3383035 RepID=A0ACC3A6V2_9EURO|nr:hypothetical protein H2198_005124 [Knufia sp. JES_112]
MLCATEAFYVISTIVLGTVALNFAIHLIRRRRSNKQRILLDAHWERKLDEDEVKEAAAQVAQIRRKRALSTTTSTRGYLNTITARSNVVGEKKIDEEDIISDLHQALKDINEKYAEVTYLGKHTARGRETDTCLYACHRINGVSKCVGEIASLQRNKHTTLLHVNVHSSDATLIKENGWGISSPVTTFHQLTTLYCATKPSEIVLPMPRNSEELNTVIVPVLEAAVCCVAGVEQLA